MKKGYTTSGIFLRVKALVIDNLILIALIYLSTDLLSIFKNNSTNIKIVLFLLIFVIYEPLCISFFGKTLGQYLNRIKVIQHNKGGKLNLLQSIIRYLFKCLLGWLSLVTISFNKDQKAIHDILVNSVVVVDDF